ncbi:insulin-like growth factor-binding protein-like 1 [Trichosurus vulpecula]|uniref:insulin-like growth factor-binding protein-like 1 n=1 Tax=Trichosurus vulpecula TaxID=9337 RepID=UPI00186B1CDA|nr:insulin-like growth factor-binding protein-like 1 [Trichosurus vulpecula]
MPRFTFPPLLLLSLLLCLWSHRLTAANDSGDTNECGQCIPESCEPLRCKASELSVRDDCGCCEQCLGAEGELCGGRGGAGRRRQARCGPGLVCVSQSREVLGAAASQEHLPEELEGTGLCVCKEDGAVCGSDGRSYQSVCALHLHSWVSVRAGRERVHKAHDGECKLAPVIVMPPKKIHNVTGAQVYLSCEVKAVPTPVITWRKITESPKGVKLLEELPGDRVNMAIQVRGGPSKHESTGWVLINPLTKEDEGIYQCHATNMVGETQSYGTIKVTELSKHKKMNFIASDDDI